MPVERTPVYGVYTSARAHSGDKPMIAATTKRPSASKPMAAVYHAASVLYQRAGGLGADDKPPQVWQNRAMHSPIDTLRARGLVAQITHDAPLEALLRSGPQTFYIGYDPTGDSLHAGHLVTLMAAAHLVQAGHRFVCLVGGATARIGDPSGKSEARPPLGHAAVAHNAECLRAQIAHLLPGNAAPVLVDNAQWLSSLHLLSYLQETAAHFSVSRMLSAETYKSRLASGLTLLEFCYQTLQAHDFAALQRSHDCRLQLGGDDQWSNILAGAELCRRRGQPQAFGLTVPLITTADGAKMGKTLGGAVWLDPNKTSPADFYQYWVNTADADLRRFLLLLTMLPVTEIEALDVNDVVTLKAAKSVLAWEVTCRVHGEAMGLQAHKAALGAFGGRELPAAVLPSSLLPRGEASERSAMPSHAVPADGQAEVVTLLVALGFAKSNNEARRLIAQGGVSLDGVRVTEPTTRPDGAALRADGVVLRAGKKRLVRLVVTR